MSAYHVRPLFAWAHLRGVNLAERYAPGRELGRQHITHAIVLTHTQLRPMAYRLLDEASSELKEPVKVRRFAYFKVGA